VSYPNWAILQPSVVGDFTREIPRGKISLTNLLAITLKEPVMENIELDGGHCRLCGGNVVRRFEKIILRTYRVAYWECSQCESLQPDFPYWLERSYSREFCATDTGAARRSILNSMNLAAIFTALQVDPKLRCVDWGGGNGLLVRLMRDMGYEFLLYDKYANNEYCIGLTLNDTQSDFSASVVTCFEVFEHFSDPAGSIDDIFRLNPDVVIIQTSPYQKQNNDWTYLSAESGQHVFFYSWKAMYRIAEKYGMKLMTVGQFFLLYREKPTTLNYTDANILSLKALHEDYPRRLNEGLVAFANARCVLGDTDAAIIMDMIYSENKS
jgi:hypothetical protein